MPRQVTESRSFACDPLPPPSAVTKYDEEFFEGVDDAFGEVGTGTRRQREANRRRLAHLIQDDVVFRQIQVKPFTKINGFLALNNNNLFAGSV